MAVCFIDIIISPVAGYVKRCERAEMDNVNLE